MRRRLISFEALLVAWLITFGAPVLAAFLAPACAPAAQEKAWDALRDLAGSVCAGNDSLRVCVEKCRVEAERRESAADAGKDSSAP